MAFTENQAEQKITQKWQELRSNGFDPGNATSDTLPIEDGWYKIFERANIYAHHVHGVYEVHGGNLEKVLKETDEEGLVIVGLHAPP